MIFYRKLTYVKPIEVTPMRISIHRPNKNKTHIIVTQYIFRLIQNLKCRKMQNNVC